MTPNVYCAGVGAGAHYLATFVWTSLAIAVKKWLELYRTDSIWRSFESSRHKCTRSRSGNRYTIGPINSLFWPLLFVSHAAGLHPFSACYLLSILYLHHITSIMSPLPLLMIAMPFILFIFFEWPLFLTLFWCCNPHCLGRYLHVWSHWPLFR